MRCRIVVWVAAALAVAGVAGAEEAYRIAWIRQPGTASMDESLGAAVDASGNVLISGRTRGTLDGPNAGGSDAFVRKYDPAGNLLWTGQLGTADYDGSYSVAADPAGNVLIAGDTRGSLGEPNAGDLDAFVSKYDPAGNPLWTRQLGTPESDNGNAVAADASGNVFISGRTCGSLGGPGAGLADGFLRKYDPAGSVLWTRQLGTDQTDECRGVAVDPSGNVLVSGWTGGSLGPPHAGGWDAFVAKYDPAGNPLWTRQLGTADDDASEGLAVDGAGNVLISGWTYGSLDGPSAGYEDAFVAKYDPAGSLLWTRQLGTADIDQSYDVAADASGNVFITGETFDDLSGPSAGYEDAFIAKYDPDGNLMWTRQPGTATYDGSHGVAADASGNVFIAGYTYGSLGGPNAGGCDAFVARFLPPPLRPGDANLDGRVDGLDYNAWSLHYLASAGWCEGDFNDDMAADGLDYNIWSLDYNPAAGAGAAVPEPACLALSAAGVAFVLLRRRRQA